MSYIDKILNETLINYFNYDYNKDGYEINKLKSINEDKKMEASKEIFDKIYKSIIEKYNSKDFKNISDTKGNVDNYIEINTILSTIDLLEDLNNKSVNKVPLIDSLRQAYNSLKKRSYMFSLGYKFENNIVKILYETTLYSLIMSTTLILITYVEILKMPNNNFDLQLKSNLTSGINNKIFIDNIIRFNEISNNGQLDTFLDGYIKNKNQTKAGFSLANASLMIFGAMMAYKIIQYFIYLIRNTIYFVYKTREDLSTWLELQKSYLEMNINKLNMINADPRIINKQKAIAQSLEKLANKIKIKIDMEEREVIKEIREEDREIQAQSILI